MYPEKSIYVKLAMQTIVATVKKLNIETIKQLEIPDELNVHQACFVSIHLLDGNLRGCIGTIEPREKNLFYEIISNATSAATKDSRFSPILDEELDKLNISVDVLSKPYLIDDINQLNPNKFGIIVSDGGFSKGVLLPNIEGIETTEKQLNIAKRKAGLTNYHLKDLKIYAFTSTRYH